MVFVSNDNKRTTNTIATVRFSLGNDFNKDDESYISGLVSSTDIKAEFNEFDSCYNIIMVENTSNKGKFWLNANVIWYHLDRSVLQRICTTGI